MTDKVRIDVRALKDGDRCSIEEREACDCDDCDICDNGGAFRGTGFVVRRISTRNRRALLYLNCECRHRNGYPSDFCTHSVSPSASVICYIHKGTTWPIPKAKKTRSARSG